MIYVYPIGGIGNMFFHIASIYALAKDNGDELSLINIDKKIYDLDNDPRWESKHANVYRYIFNRFELVNADSKKQLTYDYKYVPLKYIKEHEYLGYFQCEDYFKHRRNEILELFKPSDDFLDKINSYEHLFGNIALHVRRGDYVKLYPNIHIPQTMEYYNQALLKLPQDMKVLVFSDDLDWCRDNFIGDRYVFIDEADYIVIYLMSKMRHHVIANSSFSWWGAWMSEYENKIIISPEKWFGGRKIMFDKNMNLIPKNWIRI